MPPLALRTLLLTAATLALAACSQPAANTTAPNTAAATGTAAPPAQASAGATVPQSQMGVVIPASQLPQPRAGLWESVETETGGRPPEREQTCQSGRPRDLNMGEGCQQIDIHRTLTGGYVIAASCAGNGVSMRMNMHAEGNFTTDYTLDSEVTMGRANGPSTTSSSHKVGHYVGPCPTGMEAED